MALTNSAVIFIIMMSSTIYSVSMSADHGFKAVDSSGWTIINIGNATRYVKTTVGKTFVFTYNNASHNVLQVTQQNLDSCNTTSPILKYTSGFDIITFNKVGHFYYMCGFPDQCERGEKYDIEVVPGQIYGLSSISARNYEFQLSFGRKIGPKDNTHLYRYP
ncbi:hypothetical protein JRO89_XS01G0266600 [Xanthoceras sorbifolium]|uniref:Phytocyanin domain-containing protein n=1 Tax=Xanthoceras sorbifolium TaxID=99658 RepID=A0ABQ8IMA1_9ROSI|nr:hypothetical protein JRO89_XS01G0266600 [Xanthoceras sorbifolium]